MAKARGKYAARGMALRAFGYPGLTAWANLCRTYGAGFVQDERTGSGTYPDLD